METGYLLINKPSGPTSHEVIDRLRWITGVRRIGHAGTLDPFAEGLLLVGVGREATRNLGKFVGLDKRYRAVVRLGAVSDTYDRTGKIFNFQFSIFNDESRTMTNKLRITNYELRIKNVIDSFIGKQQQMPPQYSAKKVRGKKAYELARAGKQVDLQPQEIEIYDIKLLTTNDQLLTIEVHCSSGTYIRTLAHDIGQKLGCGAYAEELTRTATGLFELKEAINLAELPLPYEGRGGGGWKQHLITFKTVMATGTFEVFHKGHEYYLREAKKLGERLVVVVARDKTAQKLRRKALRHTERERLQRVRALPFVDEAVLGDEHDPYESVRRIKPDIIALGYDQQAFVRTLPERIKEFGFSTRIARIPPYKQDQYKSSLL